MIVFMIAFTVLEISINPIIAIVQDTLFQIPVGWLVATNDFNLVELFDLGRMKKERDKIILADYCLGS